MKSLQFKCNKVHFFGVFTDIFRNFVAKIQILIKYIKLFIEIKLCAYLICNKEFADSECSSIPGMHADGQEYGWRFWPQDIVWASFSSGIRFPYLSVSYLHVYAWWFPAYSL